jgi:hypothetical protein
LKLIVLVNSNGAEIAPNVKWPPSKFFVHVDEQGNLSPALTKQFLPARAALLANWQRQSQLNKSWYSHYQRVRLCHLPNSRPTP